jgi:hypothetical protein
LLVCLLVPGLAESHSLLAFVMCPVKPTPDITRPRTP